MTKFEKDLEWYTKHLEKVKIMHNPKNSNRPDLCKMYIKNAKEMLEKVEKGLSPF